MKFKDISMSRNSRAIPGVKTKMKIDTKDLTGGVKDTKETSELKGNEELVIGKVAKKKKSSKKKEVT